MRARCRRRARQPRPQGQAGVEGVWNYWLTRTSRREKFPDSLRSPGGLSVPHEDSPRC